MKKIEFQIDENNRLSLCDDIAAEVFEYTRKLIKDKKECLRYRLAVENCLLKWLDESSVGHKIVLILKKPLIGSPFIELRFDGPRMNPVERTDDEYEYSTRLALGLTPLYIYKRNENIIHFDLKSANTGSLTKLVIVLIMACLVGYLGTLLIPEKALNTVVTSVLTPINNTFLNALSCIAGPMVFLSVALGIYGIGDTSTLNKVGSSMIKIFMRNDILAGILCIPIFFICGLSFSGGSTSTSQFSVLFQMILDVVPSNIIEPFSSGNTLQIIFLAFAVGFALLFLGKKTASIVSAVNQINYLIQFFMEIISGLVPYFIFIVIVSLFWSGDIGVMASTWKFFVILLGALVIFTFLLLSYVSIRNKIPLFSLVRKCLPSFLIALTTASSAASFSSNMETCKKELGIDDSVSNFGIPLGMVIHNPIAIINNITVVFFFASLAEVKCSVVWLISALFVSTIMAIASPPIPGGATIIYTTLFLQLGIPSEYLVLVFAMDMIGDFIITAFEIMCLNPTILDVSSSVGMTNCEILRRKKV